MAQKQSVPTVSNGGNAKAFPPEAYLYNKDVDAKTVEEMKKDIGIDYSTDEWEIVDGFGLVVNA